ncbi:site-specific integrase [Catellatospora sp. KI3]|uniref:tyrosine-type recombinase/integrase n=1 Tax=Catellatospora sp. KI3 TaxID=3041620 RepID=UPI00248319CC|nr:site-specific integrase [Catellatospora sp. KI3]MDI1466368.1 site-specific integrase [Catellatospora sp. KI3]
MKSRSVRVWAIKTNVSPTTKKRSYTVRWKVAGQEKSATFAGRALADNYRSDLMQAIKVGEEFDVDTGLPDSMRPAESSGPTWLEFVERYVAMKWPDAAAKSRVSMVEALITVTPALVRAEGGGVPDEQLLRRALQRHLIPGQSSGIGDGEADALEWLRAASVPLASLSDAQVVRAGLDAVGRLMDGSAAAATTRRRKRAVFYNVLEYAIELELLTHNPVDRLRVRSRRAKVVEVVDRRVVASPRQARELLTAVTYVGRRDGERGERLRGFFACMYYGALRPGEAVALRESDCLLPATCEDCRADLTIISRQVPVTGCEHRRLAYSWGRLTLERNRPEVGRAWTDSGDVHDDRGLKHRGDDEPRMVPIPPELVEILREHLRRFGTARDGRLFQSPNGKVVGTTTYARVWSQARHLALIPARVVSVLAGRPYDLRHAAVSLWLNAGVPAPEVAERAGHSVEVLLKVYAKCIDGQEETINRRIEQALRSEPA